MDASPPTSHEKHRRSRGQKLLIWSVGLLLVLLAAIVLVIATFNWNRLRPLLDRRISQALGRPFVIQGKLSVEWRHDESAGWLADLLPWPEFTANDIRIDNPGWASQPQFAHLDALRFRLSPWPLLAHRVVIPSMQLIHPTLNLERDARGRANWQFKPTGKAGPSRWRLDLDAIGFDRGWISLQDARRQTDLRITVTPLQHAIPFEQVMAQASAAARKQTGARVDATAAAAVNHARKTPAPQTAVRTSYRFGWQVAGRYQGAPIAGHGKTGAVLALQQPDQPFPIQADVHIGGSHVVVIGTLTDPMHLDALDMKLWLSGPSMARLYPIFGVTLPDTPPYATAGRLLAELHRDGSRFSYRDFRGRVGGSDLRGSLTYTTGGKRPKLSGKLKSEVLQFTDLAPLIGAPSADAKTARETVQGPPGRLLPATPFRSDRWKAMDADVTFDGERILHGKKLPLDSLHTHIVLDNGVLQLDPLRFGLAGGTIASTLVLNGNAMPMHGTLKLQARHIKLKQLFPTFQPMHTSFGEINGDLDLEAHGNSVAALLGSASGETKLLMNDGAISKTLLETAGLNVANIVIGKLFGDKTVRINCAATDLSANNGLFTTRLFVFDTTDALIHVTGTVNFANEHLDLHVKPQTKGLRILSLRSPLYVKGTLKHPDVGVQAGPLILRGAGAAALAVFAAPAAALLPLIVPSRDSTQKNTCRAMLEKMRQEPGKTPAGPHASRQAHAH
ncbi:MAG: AsmA family protein [Rhodanobacter sp.]|nr:MAG: AsmA family protein [Rhodanobacter sp.]